jgi:hypothetical protein
VGERDTFGMLKFDPNEGCVVFILAGHIRDFKIAWNLFSPKEKIISHVNEGKFSSFLIDDERAELRSIPFEEGGNDTCMDGDKGYCELIGSWGMLGYLFWTVLAYLIISNTSYVLQVACKMVWFQYFGLKYDWVQGLVICLIRLISQINTHYMMVHGSMVTRCMPTWCMNNLDAKNDDLALNTSQVDMAASDKAQWVFLVTWTADVHVG